MSEATLIGYRDGVPIAAGGFGGPEMATREEALEIVGEGADEVREFAHGDPALRVELEKWVHATIERAWPDNGEVME